MENVDCRYHLTDQPAIDSPPDERRCFCCQFGAATPCTDPDNCFRRKPCGPLQSPAGLCGGQAVSPFVLLGCLGVWLNIVGIGLYVANEYHMHCERADGSCQRCYIGPFMRECPPSRDREIACIHTCNQLFWQCLVTPPVDATDLKLCRAGEKTCYNGCNRGRP